MTRCLARPEGKNPAQRYSSPYDFEPKGLENTSYLPKTPHSFLFLLVRGPRPPSSPPASRPGRYAEKNLCLGMNTHFCENTS
jgi:hypothetical protein